MRLFKRNNLTFFDISSHKNQRLSTTESADAAVHASSSFPRQVCCRREVAILKAQVTQHSHASLRVRKYERVCVRFVHARVSVLEAPKNPECGLRWSDLTLESHDHGE